MYLSSNHTVTAQKHRNSGAALLCAQKPAALGFLSTQNVSFYEAKFAAMLSIRFIYRCIAAETKRDCWGKFRRVVAIFWFVGSVLDGTV